MTFYLSLFVSLILIIIAVFSVILSYADSNRMRAFVSAKALKEHLDVVIRSVVEYIYKQDADPASTTQLQPLANRYSGLKKNKDAFDAISLANSIVTLYNSLDISHSLSSYADARAELRDALAAIKRLRFEYNKSVEKLNKMLNKRLIAGAGKVLRMKKLEELCDLSSSFYGV